MAGRWTPIHENHAISVMAVAIKFVTPIPMPLFRKVLSAVEQEAEKNGFLDRRQAHDSFEIKIERGVASPPKAVNTAGVIFSAYVEDEAGDVLKRVPSEQIQIGVDALVYRTWDYISWSWQKKRVLSLLAGAVDALSGIVAVASVRLEYLDRFYFDGPVEEADPKKLLKNESRYVSPHVMEQSDLWHSHTGCYIPNNSSVKHLLQINIDALDEANEQDVAVRWINMLTARENRYPNSADDAVALDASVFSSDIEGQHAELKIALAEILDENMAKVIYLEG